MIPKNDGKGKPNLFAENAVGNHREIPIYLEASADAVPPNNHKMYHKRINSHKHRHSNIIMVQKSPLGRSCIEACGTLRLVEVLYLVCRDCWDSQMRKLRRSRAEWHLKESFWSKWFPQIQQFQFLDQENPWKSLLELVQDVKISIYQRSRMVATHNLAEALSGCGSIWSTTARHLFWSAWTPRTTRQQYGRSVRENGLLVRPDQVRFTFEIWVCLKMGYTLNYSHLIGIMIINHWV